MLVVTVLGFAGVDCVVGCTLGLGALGRFGTLRLLWGRGAGFGVVALSCRNSAGAAKIPVPITKTNAKIHAQIGWL